MVHIFIKNQRTKKDTTPGRNSFPASLCPFYSVQILHTSFTLTQSVFILLHLNYSHYSFIFPKLLFTQRIYISFIIIHSHILYLWSVYSLISFIFPLSLFAQSSYISFLLTRSNILYLNLF